MKLALFGGLYLAHAVISIVQEGCHCVGFHPDGNIIAIGCLTAKWMVIDIVARDIISTHIDGMERLECVAYSPGTLHGSSGHTDCR